MKKIILTLIVSVSFSSLALADVGTDLKGHGSYGMAGCGLGSAVFQENTGISQILASTTNGTFGSQTFGISSGTSNCSSHGVAKLDKETEMFVEVNYDVLQKEISQGKGETLNSFATLMGCTDTDVLGKGLQSNYKKLSAASNSSDFLNNVKATIQSDSTLSSTCKARS
jgi:hypothetical protein